MKINNQHEFYTAKGMHPVEVKKQLKPITKFIIDEHILKLKDTAKVDRTAITPSI